MISKKVRVIDYLFLLLIFLISINFMNWTNFLFFLWILIGVFFFLLSKSKFSVSKEFVILFLFSTTFFLVDWFYSSIYLQKIITFWLGPVLAYFFGSLYSDFQITNHTNSLSLNKRFYSIIFPIIVIVLGYFSHGILNFIINLNTTSRVLVDVWTNASLLATLQNLYFTPFLAFIAIPFFSRKESNSFEKVFVTIALILVIYSGFVFGNRAIFVIMVAVLIINIMFNIIASKKSYKSLILYSLTVFSLIASAYLLYSINGFGIRDFVDNSILGQRIISGPGGIFNDPRFKILEYIYNNFSMFYLGGGSGLVNYAHNMWLDVYLSTGLVPFIFLIAYSFYTLITTLKTLRKTSISMLQKHVILSFYVALNLNFALEPIIQGVPYMFILMCFFNGYINRLSKIQESPLGIGEYL